MRASLRLGKVFGIPIEVNASWVLIFLLLIYVTGHLGLSFLLGGIFAVPG